MNLSEKLRKKRGSLELRKNKKWIKWNPYHSKLSAYILGGGMDWPFKSNSKILYLGSAEGNTIGFLSEICFEGRIIGVDISATAMAELLVLAKQRSNIIPFLGDAHFPKTYKIHTGKPDVLYQDIAQRDQIEIFMRNYDFFSPECGLLMLKSRSTPGDDEEIFKKCEKELDSKFTKVSSIDIGKWAKGHMAYYVE